MERTVTEVKQGDNAVTFIFNDKEFCVFAKFGNTIYSTTSPGVLKKTLTDIKKDIQEFGFNAEVLSRLYIKNYKNK
jgi:hypothetical protein